MRNLQKAAQQGFTMIELIVVIVILGVLAATALPKFFDLGSDAKAAALQGVAGAANSAMSLNYGGCAVVGNVVTANKCVKIRNCNEVPNILQGGLPTGYTVANLAIAAIGTNEPACTITQTAGGATATFTGIGAGT
ncbi:type II secretion system protein [Pelomonas sp. SE-A7]|uniref:type II secretion system protein n=1 Tax=Pelomonas sp. SE-A7 TaxID=3054953 RepID=UPI00259C809C|nr:type II secretion system protein [Pelomonas sp. SE-A7]MDM4767787.1 type II secretion system protein [Pelomonas sp. SE-A7]